MASYDILPPDEMQLTNSTLSSTTTTTTTTTTVATAATMLVTTLLNNASMKNISSNCSTVKSSLEDDTLLIDRTFTPFIYIIGFPGNILSFIIWIRPRMRHSSGMYLATLAAVDFIFLALQLLFELNVSWQVNTLNYPVMCEVFPVVFMTFQYLAPLLVLAFTIERYISICHPFKREQFCTTRRAKIVSVSLACVSFGICAIQGYFWTYTDEHGCGIRYEMLNGGNSSIWNVWSWITEILFFLVVPLNVLFFNILVIREAKRMSKYEQSQLHGRTQKTSATTVMLLAVSFYLIVTTLPVTVMYVTVLNFPEGDIDLCGSKDADPTWRRYLIYELIRTVIREIGMTHFALNFYIYMVTGKMFRKEFKTMLLKLLGKSLPEKVRTEYTTLRSSFRGNNHVKNPITVRLSSNGTTCAKGDETNL